MRESARELAQRRAVHRARAGIDEVTDRLRLQQVEFAVADGAFHELPRQRWTRARLHQCREYRWRDERAAVHGELDHILAGRRARPGEDGHQRIVERFIVRVTRVECDAVWCALRQCGGHPDARGDRSCACPTQANDGEGTAARRRRDRGDRVAAEISASSARSHQAASSACSHQAVSSARPRRRRPRSASPSRARSRSAIAVATRRDSAPRSTG